MSNKRARLIVPLLGVLLAAAVVLIVYLVASSGDREPDPGARDDRELERRRALEEQRSRLQQVLTAKRPPRRVSERPLEPPERPVQADRDPVSLTPRQRAALKSALDGFYSPSELADALRDRSAPAYARQVSHEYQQALEAESLGDGPGSVPVTPEVDEVLKRMGVVRDYVMNMLHTLRPEGQEQMQQQMIDRMNESIGRRIDQLNSDYPFLGVVKVEEL